MKITTAYMGQLQHQADKENEAREYPDGTSILEVLRVLADEYGDVFTGILFDDSGGLRPSVMLLHNEAPVSKDALPALQDGDSLTLLAAIAGG
jgi:molybdopterin converting factor small subunit